MGDLKFPRCVPCDLFRVRTQVVAQEDVALMSRGAIHDNIEMVVRRFGGRLEGLPSSDS